MWAVLALLLSALALFFLTRTPSSASPVFGALCSALFSYLWLLWLPLSRSTDRLFLPLSFKPFGAFFVHRRRRIGLCEVPYCLSLSTRSVRGTNLLDRHPSNSLQFFKSVFLSSSFGFLARHLRWWKCFFCTCLASGRVFAASCSLALFPVCLLCVCGFTASYAPLWSAAALWFLFLMSAPMVIARTLVRAYLCLFCCRWFTKGLAVHILPLISHVFLFVRCRRYCE